MSDVSLKVNFTNGMSEEVLQKEIKRDFYVGGLLFKINFKNGMAADTVNKRINRQFLPGGIPLTVNFISNIPADTISKQINRTFYPGGRPFKVNFKNGMNLPAKSIDIWRFVKWTLSDLTNEKYYILRSIEKPFVTIDPLPILPKLRGQAYPETRRPEYNIVHKESASAIAKTYETWQFPRWYIELTYEFLAGNAEGSDFRRLLDFFIARRGQLEDFWYEDPEDNQVAHEVIAIGDGKEKIFQLCRTYCGSKEPVFAVNADHIFRLTVNDEVQSAAAFSLTNDGRVMFKQPPGNGVVIKVSFHFYYRCRFTDDIAEFENFAHKLWSLKTLSFVTTL